ncbi:hydroxymethylglutaryl-CoA lyase [Arenibaculum pallidiluteum]|uniref:hydroxymethylglutaryl-CoA lyase n=1 Tax=Arenibaculum pallidiluteum TaxID=2812559 RepID=UPI001A9615B9|nr:hydroxymethylglutaryl-CoA lyase [Arenibaculum pallidiluteum]
MLNLPDSVMVAEVGPRDGLQSLPDWIDTDTKVRMVDRLSEAGFPVIEVTGFVSPRAVPNLRDADEVFARIRRRPGTVYRALVPNARGAERAAAAGVDEMLGLITAGTVYLRKNQNMSPDEAVAQAGAAYRIADGRGIPFVMAIGMAFWCAYEGLVDEDQVLALAGQLRNHGIRRFYLAGSVGMEDPAHVGRLIGRLYDAFPDVEVGFHAHDLSGWGPANVLAAIAAGARWVEGSICGIGGGVAMPGAVKSVGSVGNLPTEDIVSMLEAMGIRTGVDPDAVVTAAREIAAMLGIEPRSRSAMGAVRDEILAVSGVRETAPA